MAKYQATQVDANFADPGMLCPGINSNPFHDTTCERGIPSDATSSRPFNLPAPKLICISNFFDALKARMPSKHRFGHTNPTTSNYSNHKGLISLAQKSISSAFWTMFNLSIKMKIHHRTGTHSIRRMLFDSKPRPVFNAPSVITQTVPFTFYQVVNTRISLV